MLISNTFGFSAIVGSLFIVATRGLDQNDRINPSYLPICVSAPLDHTFAARGCRKVICSETTFLTASGVLKKKLKKMFRSDFGDALLHGEGYRVPPNGLEGIILKKNLEIILV